MRARVDLSLAADQIDNRQRLPDYVTASVTHFVAFEVVNLIEMLVWIGFLTSGRHGAVIAVVGMEMVVYVAVEVLQGRETTGRRR